MARGLFRHAPQPQQRLHKAVPTAGPTTVPGSFTADAIVLDPIAGTFTANAVTKKTLAFTFTTDAIARKTASATFTADAVLKKTISATPTATPCNEPRPRVTGASCLR